ncbi:hypothetical protein [Marinospirillum sp.]|uniref:hypothetical protein n=1 Tax=Marinospirillum sp. TaxID=2183934 RepID=UPI0028703BCA|nr:hypothetical protein [Marinospirillum sp.]MDR9467475.1 hypothetical protein [Marinospirillum sp.]
MKKLIVSLALVGFSLPLMAQESISLTSGSRLEVSSVDQVRLQEGQSKENVWFAVDPAQVSSSSEKQLSNCVMTAHLSLEQGSLHFTSQSLRCPSLTGDVFTAEEIHANLTDSLSQLCTSSGTSCTEVTFSTSQVYTLELEEASQLIAAQNASREANRARIEEQLQNQTE